MERPLPDDVARPVRSYLAALVPAAEVSDAWHELLADVRYWGDRELVPVLRLAHQVVAQHVRVAPEAAVLALEEAGIGEVGRVAAVLDVDTITAEAWLDDVDELRDGETASPVPAVPSGAVPAPEPEPEAAPEPAPAEPATAAAAGDEPAAADPAVRIGFDEDPLPASAFDEAGGDRLGADMRRLLVGVALLVALVVVLWLLTGR